MKRREFIVTTARAAGALLPGMALAQTRPCPPSPISVSGGTSITPSCAAGDAEADWVSRSNGPGVVWAHDFRSPEEVDKFVYWSSSATRRDVWLTGDQRSSVDGPFQIPADIKAAYPTGDGIPGTGGGSLNAHLAIGRSCQGQWMRPFNAFTGATNGRGVDDPARGVMRQAWDTHATSRDRIRFWKKGYYAHPDNWTLPGGAPNPLRALSEGFEREGEEFWLQFRYKVPAARFGPQEPNGKLIFINKLSTGSAIEDSHGGQIFLESNGNWTGDSPGFPGFFAALNRKAGYFGYMTSPQGQIGTYIEQPGASWGTTCTYPPSAAKCGQTFNAIMVPDEWVTIMIHVKVGHQPMWGIPISNYTQIDATAKSRFAGAGVKWDSGHSDAPDLRKGRADAYGDQIYGAGNNDSAFEMFVARAGASQWATVYSKKDYVFSHGPDYRVDSSGNVVRATMSGRGFQSAQFGAYMNTGVVGTGAVDAPWYQRFTQIIFSRQPIPLPAPGA